MKKDPVIKTTLFAIAISLLFNVPSAAQGIKITAGTRFKCTGPTQRLVLSNGMGLHNHTALDLSNLHISFTGNEQTLLGGTAPLTIGKLELRMAPGSGVVLQHEVSITRGISFATGLLDLNNHLINLEANAVLENENAAGRLTGVNGGAIQITIDLQAPNNYEPGNLGLQISSSQNMGLTTFRRSHRAQTNAAGGTSINRTFEIIPASQSELDASLHMQYFDEELNGLAEDFLEFYQSANNGNSWHSRGMTARNNNTNTVTINNLSKAGLLTLSTINNTLPISITAILLSCVNQQPTLKWKVANPEDVSEFRIEKSNNAQHWETLPQAIPPASSSRFEYQFTDKSTVARYYRLKSIEHNGEVSLSPLLRNLCEGNLNNFNLLNNPVSNELQLGIHSDVRRQLQLTVFDNQGRSLLHQSVSIDAGHSIRSVNLLPVPAGLYHLRLTEQGRKIFSTSFLKK